MRSNDFPLLIVMVASNYDNWSQAELASFKRSLKRQYPDVRFAFYKTADSTIEAVDEEDVLDLLKQS
jgi:hypothetical protein